MSLQIFCGALKIKHEFVKFSDGGSNFKILSESIPILREANSVTISLNTATKVNDYLWEILLVVDALGYLMKRDTEITIYLPYLPHGRADRVFEVGNSFPLKIFFDILDNFVHKIILTDPHNEEVVNELMRVYGFEYDIKTQHSCLFQAYTNFSRDTEISQNKREVLVLPDQGAKVKAESQNLGNVFDITIQAEKNRNKQTGKIENIFLNTEEDLSGKTCWIVDDICDGGGTFIPLAKLLKQRGAAKVILYVTHGIFAKGLQLFRPHIDYLCVYQTVGTYVNHQDISDFNQGLEVK